MPASITSLCIVEVSDALSLFGIHIAAGPARPIIIVLGLVEVPAGPIANIFCVPSSMHGAHPLATPQRTAVAIPTRYGSCGS